MLCQVCHGWEAESRPLSATLRSQLEQHLNVQLLMQVTSLPMCNQCCLLLEYWHQFSSKAQANIESYCLPFNTNESGGALLTEEREEGLALLRPRLRPRLRQQLMQVDLLTAHDIKSPRRATLSQQGQQLSLQVAVPEVPLQWQRVDIKEEPLHETDHPEPNLEECTSILPVAEEESGDWSHAEPTQEILRRNPHSSVAPQAEYGSQDGPSVPIKAPGCVQSVTMWRNIRPNQPGQDVQSQKASKMNTGRRRKPSLPVRSAAQLTHGHRTRAYGEVLGRTEETSWSSKEAVSPVCLAGSDSAPQAFLPASKAAWNYSKPCAQANSCASRQPVCPTADSLGPSNQASICDEDYNDAYFTVPDVSLNVYNCEVCSVQCGSKRQIKSHLCLHFGVAAKPLKCSHCYSEFSYQYELQAHKKALLHGDALLVCQVCEKLFSEKFELMKHLKYHRFECQVCHLLLDNKQDHQSHLLCDHSLKNKVENTSRLNLQTEFDVNSRTRGCNLDDGVLFPCCACSAKFPACAVLCAHLRQVHPGLSVCECGQCGQVLSTATSYTGHLRRQHSGKMKFSCPYCNSVCGEREFFVRHLGGSVPQGVNVEACKVPANEKQGRNPLHCEVCNEISTGQAAFEKHRLNHIKHSKYKCDICQKKLLFECQLLKHKNKHKSFSCPYCREINQTKLALKEHVKQVHGGRPAYVCSDCKAGFRTARTLTNHTQMHRDQRIVTHCPDGKKINSVAESSMSSTEETSSPGPFRETFPATQFQQNYEIINPRITLCDENIGTVSDTSKSFGVQRNMVSKNFVRHRARPRSARRKQRVPCGQCDMDFVNEKAMRMHEKAVHAGLPFYSCAVCGKVYMNAKRMLKHTEQHNASKHFE